MEKKSGLNILFFSRMVKLVSLMLPRGTPLAIAIFVGVLVFAGLYEVSGYYTGLISSQFFRVLVAREDYDSFLRLAWESMMKVLITVFLKSTGAFLVKLLSIQWRKNLTTALHQVYYQGVKFYELNVLNSIDNPDQRMTQDVERLCTTTSGTIAPLFLSPFKIGYYSYMAYSTSDWYGPVAIYIMFLCSTIINQGLMSRIIHWVFLQERGEGSFRFVHMGTRYQAESIAFYRAGAQERGKADSRFDDLFRIQRRLFSWFYALDISCNTFDYLGAILSYLVIGFPIFDGKYDNLSKEDLSAVISKNGFVCIMLISSFSQLVDLASKVSDIAGNAHRVGELLEVASSSPPHTPQSTPTPPQESDPIMNLTFAPGGSTCSGAGTHCATFPHHNPDIAFVLNGLTCTPPRSQQAPHDAQLPHFLIKNLFLELAKGKDIIITGPSGCGKSSLLRVLFKLWPKDEMMNSASAVVWNLDHLDPNQIVILPQTPFILDEFDGSPITSELKLPASAHLAFDETKAKECLIKVGFADLLNKSRKSSWRQTLSPGEKQKLSFARLLYHSPTFAVLDEATSCLDEETEELLYKLCREAGMTLLTVGHRSTLKKFHGYELHIARNGSWTFSEIAPPPYMTSD